ncbi:MAG: lysophospholipid acyltransferase family protein [Planctomycetales bacterium]
MPLDPEFLAVLTLVAYASIAAAVVVANRYRKAPAWDVWLLYCVERIYLPLMFHWRANRRAPFPEQGAALVIANHRSPVDPLMIWMNHHLSWPSRRVRVIGFLTAKEYCELPGVRRITRAVRSIPVERGGSDMGPAREALRRLQNGELVGVFPEGRINLRAGLLEATPGIAWLALRAQVPVFPVFLHGTPQKGSMVAPFYTPSRVRVTFGEPIDLSAYRDRPKSRPVLMEVTRLLMERLAATGGLDPATVRVVEREGGKDEE